MLLPPQSSPPQQPWAHSAPSFPPPPQDAPLRRPFLVTPLGVCLLIAAGVTLAGIGALIYVFSRNDRNPTVNIPPPTLPNPNAFNFYVQTGKRIVRTDEIDANFPNAKTKEKKTFSLAQKADLIAANREPLTAFRSHFAIPYRQPPVQSFYEKFPYYAQYRNGARLMALESQGKAANGDANGAINAGLDGVQFGRKINSGAPFIGGLVSIAMQYIGRRPVWSIRDRLKASEAKAAARRLERLQKVGGGYADILTEEKEVTQRSVLEMMRDPEGFTRKMNETASPEERSDAEGVKLEATSTRIMFQITGKQRVMDNLTAYYDALIAQTKRPYAADHKPIPLPKDFLGKTLPEFSSGRFKFAANDAQNALLMVDLALRAYKGERSAYPETLNALIPAYLSRLPADPFAVSGPLRYRRTPKGYTLYSVGPDGKNDNGTIIQNPDARTDREKHLAKETSRGDMVAGINR